MHTGTVAGVLGAGQCPWPCIPPKLELDHGDSRVVSTELQYCRAWQRIQLVVTVLPSAVRVTVATAVLIQVFLPCPCDHGYHYRCPHAWHRDRFPSCQASSSSGCS